MDTIIEKVLFLQNIEMFSDIPSEQLAHLAAITTMIRCSKGDALFEENEPSQTLYLLIEGKVQLMRDGKLTREVSKNEPVGVWGFFDQEPRLVTAVCAEDSQLLRIDSTEFFDLLEERVHMSRGLLKYFVKRIRRLIEVADTIV